MEAATNRRRLPGSLFEWMAAGRTYSEFREAFPEYSEWDISAAIHALPKPVVFARPRTPYLEIGAPALSERLGALYAIFKDPLSENRSAAERTLVDEWAVDLFSYCRQKPMAGLRFLAMLQDAETQTYLVLTKDGFRVSLVVGLRLGFWKRIATQLPPFGFMAPLQS